MLQLTSTNARKRVYGTCSNTIPVTAFRNHILEAKEMLECWITVMTLNYTFLFMLVPDEALLRPRFTFSRIERLIMEFRT
jgi:hypothetical protein